MDEYLLAQPPLHMRENHYRLAGGRLAYPTTPAHEGKPVTKTLTNLDNSNHPCT